MDPTNHYTVQVNTTHCMYHTRSRSTCTSCPRSSFALSVVQSHAIVDCGTRTRTWDFHPSNDDTQCVPTSFLPSLFVVCCKNPIVDNRLLDDPILHLGKHQISPFNYPSTNVRNMNFVDPESCLLGAISRTSTIMVFLHHELLLLLIIFSKHNLHLSRPNHS